MDAFRPFVSIGSAWVEITAQCANANPFCVRLLSMWTQIGLKFGSGLRPHGQQTDAPRVCLVSAPAPRASDPTPLSQSFLMRAC